MGMIGIFIAVPPARLESLLGDPELIEPLLEQLETPDAEGLHHLDVDKAWHAIHFTLNGAAWEGELPLVNTVLGGTEFGEDSGYGPSRYLDSDEVREVANALPSSEAFSARFDSKALEAAEVYPDIWSRPDEPHREWVVEHYEDLCGFYRAAAARRDCVLLLLH